MTDDSWRTRLEEVLEKDKRSMREVSIAAGLSPGYLHGILRDDKEPTLDRFIKICRELNVSLAYMLMGLNITAATEDLIVRMENNEERLETLLSLFPEKSRDQSS